jgi:hypothetical protein
MFFVDLKMEACYAECTYYDKIKFVVDTYFGGN